MSLIRGCACVIYTAGVIAVILFVLYLALIGQIKGPTHYSNEICKSNLTGFSTIGHVQVPEFTAVCTTLVPTPGKQ